jgi:hypothetical protein
LARSEFTGFIIKGRRQAGLFVWLTTSVSTEEMHPYRLKKCIAPAALQPVPTPQATNG